MNINNSYNPLTDLKNYKPTDQAHSLTIEISITGEESLTETIPQQHVNIERLNQRRGGIFSQNFAGNPSNSINNRSTLRRNGNASQLPLPVRSKPQSKEPKQDTTLNDQSSEQTSTRTLQSRRGAVRLDEPLEGITHLINCQPFEERELRDTDLGTEGIREKIFAHINLAKYIKGKDDLEALPTDLSQFKMLDFLAKFKEGGYKGLLTAQGNALDSAYEGFLKSYRISIITDLIYKEYKASEIYEKIRGFVKEKGEKGAKPNINQRELNFLKSYGGYRSSFTIFSKDRTPSPDSVEYLINDTASCIINLITILEPGEEFIFVGGSASPQGNHAVLYQVEKQIEDEDEQEEQRYRFSIFDTDAPPEFEISKLNNPIGILKHRIPIRLYISDISEAVISQKAFWHKLINLCCIPKADHTMKNVYQTLNSLGKIRIDKEGIHSQQVAGTCAWKCLMAYIRHKLGKQGYYIFKVALIDDSIKNFVEQTGLSLKHQEFLSKIEKQEEKSAFFKKIWKHWKRARLSSTNKEDLLKLGIQHFEQVKNKSNKIQKGRNQSLSP